MFRSIRWRLVLSYIALSLLILGVVGVVSLELIETSAENHERDLLRANAESVAAEAEKLMWPAANQPALQSLVETSALLGGVRVQIRDARGGTLADSLRGGQDDLAWLLLPHHFELEVPEDLLGTSWIEFSTGRRLAMPFSLREQTLLLEQFPAEAMLTIMRPGDGYYGSGRPYVHVVPKEGLAEVDGPLSIAHRSDQAFRLPVGPEDHPLGSVVVSDGPDLVSGPLDTAREAFVYAAIGALLLAVAAGLVVSRGLTAPLRELTSVAGEMSGGDLSVRAPSRRKDEIGQLSAQFNQMAGRLEASFGELAAERDALRRFVADASHELRTPITALRSFNDLMQGPAAQDEPARVEFLAESSVQLERLEWITANLLNLSRLDAGLVDLNLARHEAGELVKAAALGFRAMVADREIDLRVQAPEGLSLICDRERIEVALSNLLDNALKFVPPGGKVGIGAEAGEAAVLLWVRDNGPGIEPDDMPRIFDRFYQGRRSCSQGYGLGLAIVQSIVQAHGGTITVESQLGQGALFTIQIPATLSPLRGEDGIGAG